MNETIDCQKRLMLAHLNEILRRLTVPEVRDLDQAVIHQRLIEKASELFRQVEDSEDLDSLIALVPDLFNIR